MTTTGIDRTTAFSLPIRVYYEDTDAGGVVYYANYLKYCERARTEWLRAAGFDQRALSRERNLLFAVRSIALDYERPARLDDMLSVTVEPVAARRASAELTQRVIGADGGTLVHGRVRIASIDATTFRPRAMPDDVQEVFL